MAQAIIKTEYLGKRVGFNGSAAPLYKRKDIDQLAIMALESKNPSLLKLFEKLPELSVLKKEKTDMELKKIVPVVAVENNQTQRKEKWNAGQQKNTDKWKSKKASGQQ